MSERDNINNRLELEAEKLLQGSVAVWPGEFMSDLGQETPMEHHLVLRFIPGKGGEPGDVQQEFFENTKEDIESAVYCCKLADEYHLNAYIGIYSYPTYGRASRAYVGIPMAVAADLDCGEGRIGDNTGRPKYQNKQEALTCLLEVVRKGLLPMPSAIVDSGNGIQVWWPLSDPEEVSENLWTRVMVKIADLLRADMTRAKNPTALMRVPGPRNAKDPKNLKTTRVLYYSRERFPLDRFPLADAAAVKKAGIKPKASLKRGHKTTKPGAHTPSPLMAEIVKTLAENGVITQYRCDSDGRFVGFYFKECPLCGSEGD